MNYLMQKLKFESFKFYVCIKSYFKKHKFLKKNKII